MSIAPALLAIQISTMTSRGYGGIDSKLSRKWSTLSGWRSALFGVFVFFLCAVALAAMFVAGGLAVMFAVWFASFTPTWLGIVGAIVAAIAWIASIWGIFELLYLD